MGKTVLIASNNRHKIEEISQILAFTGWNFVSMNDLCIQSNPLEDGKTFMENARIKAYAARDASGEGISVIADDSGLVVDALGGEPGIYSARYAGDHVPDEMHNKKLLDSLKGVSDADRTARFVCSLVYIDCDDSIGEISAEGYIEGKIGFEPRGDGGFGYDPIFYPDVYHGSKSLAQVSAEEKGSISHRGNALRNLAKKISQTI